jgi:hypothetical protein
MFTLLDLTKNILSAINQQLIIQKLSKASEMAARKPQNEGLPQWVEAQWF